MRDTIALALVRAELCRAQAAAQRRRLDASRGDAVIALGHGMVPRALIPNDRGMRRGAPVARRGSTPPD